MEKDYAEIAHAYAANVLSGEIDACGWVKKTCQRHINNLLMQGTEEFPYVFAPEKAARPCSFIEKLPHIKGEWAKRKEKITLQPWQIFNISMMFGWVYAETRLRRFQTVYFEVPRKNAKSTMLAALGLFCMAADGEEGAEIYSAATTRDQAKIVWKCAWEMVRKTSGLRKWLGVETMAHSIMQTKTGSFFKPLSSRDDTQDGLNPHLSIIDEIHAHKTRALWDVLETAIGAREQSLTCAITTAGVNLAGIAYELRTYLTKILDNVISDDSFYGIIYTLDDDDLKDETHQDRLYTDEALFRKANPNYGISVNPDTFKAAALKALYTPSARANFLTKRLNIWSRSNSPWMPMVEWFKCADDTLAEDDFIGQRCMLGLDLATKKDINSKVKLFAREMEGKTHYYCFATHYLPEEAIDTSKNSQYRGWEESGWIVTTPGNIIDFDLIEADIKNDAELYDIDQAGFDPMQATQLSTHLLEAGVQMVEVRPTVLNFSEPMKTLEALVLSGRFHFNSDPVLTWMASNVVAHLDKKDNIYPNKEHYDNKIDGIVALLMALNRWLAEDENKSVYESGDLVYL